MTSLHAHLRWLLLVGLCLGAGGCLPSATNRSDEEQEPYFQRGKALASSLDYKGAGEAFEKALEVNPHNGLAHFELGLLYQREDTDLAAAIYHFQRFLELRPASEHADFVRQRINACKQDMAKATSVSMAPVTQAMQRDLDRLTAENSRLMQENRELRRHLDAWQAYAARHPGDAPGVSNAAAGPARLEPEPQSAGTVRTSRTEAGTDGSGRGQARSASRSYTVKRGEALYTIARSHGVKLSALVAANPGVDPKRLKAGQTIVIPAP